MTPRKRAKALIDEHRPRAECFILCDYARVENGKLYIIGGGWDQITPQILPLSFPAYLAMKIVLPGAMAVQSVNIRIELLDQDGKMLGEPVLDAPLQGTLTAEFTGTVRNELPKAPVFLAVGVQMQIARPGEFRTRLLIDDEAIAETGFSVASPLLTGSSIAPDEPSPSPGTPDEH
jgi:hypothetical protein